MVQGREDSLDTNAPTRRGAQHPALLEEEDLPQQVRHLSEEVARLQTGKQTGKQPKESISGVICWGCKEGAPLP